MVAFFFPTGLLAPAIVAALFTVALWRELRHAAPKPPFNWEVDAWGDFGVWWEYTPMDRQEG